MRSINAISRPPDPYRFLRVIPKRWDRNRGRSFWSLLLTLAVFSAAATESQAIPYYARRTGLSCVDCHVAPPKLNTFGEAFLGRGYRLAAERDRKLFSAVPISVWITGRYEERSDQDLSKSYMPKVELVSGGPIRELPLSYFIEWRVVSLDMRNDGSLRDRGGRFEDALLNWEIADSHTLRIGQFRSLNQYDVSLRLSVSEPVIFSTALPGEISSDPRITGLRGFSPAGRSPGIAYSIQSLKGTSPADGLFHIVNVPFVGELSVPLGSEARREASFELEGPAKGVFLETFYRRGLNSIGAHAYLDNDRWLATGVGRVHYKDFYATAGIGIDDVPGRALRTRYSLEGEYIWSRHDRFRPGLGFRVEQISHARRDPACIPYLVLAGPNTDFGFVLQVEARFQGSSHGVFVDLSAIF